MEKPRPRENLRKQRRSPSGRYNSNVIRLANNNLVDTKGLYRMALDVVEYPEDIAWLDLSFNDITKVDLGRACCQNAFSRQQTFSGGRLDLSMGRLPLLCRG